MRKLVIAVSVIVPLVCLPLQIYGSYLWTFPLVAIWHIGIDQAPCSDLGFRRQNFIRSLVVGVLTGIALGVACGEVTRFMGIVGVSQDELTAGGVSFGSSTGFQLANQSQSTNGLVLYFLYYITFVGLGEELFWRGLIQQKLKKRTNQHVAVLLTGAAFGLIHLFLFLVLPFGKGLVFLLMIALGGIIWGYLFDVFRNICVVAVSHGITSAIIWKYYFFA